MGSQVVKMLVGDEVLQVLQISNADRIDPNYHMLASSGMM